VARLNEEAAQLDLTELGPADVAHQVTTACRPLAEHKEVNLRERTAGPVPAQGDAKRLSQALNRRSSSRSSTPTTAACTFGANRASAPRSA
jgi:signal transduction histidine kinase